MNKQNIGKLFLLLTVQLQLCFFPITIAISQEGNDLLCRPPPTEKRLLRDIVVNGQSPVFAVYPNLSHTFYGSFVSDEIQETYDQNLMKIGWQTWSDDLPHVDVLLVLNSGGGGAPKTIPMVEQIKKTGKVSHFIVWDDDIHWTTTSDYLSKHSLFSLPYLNIMLTAAPTFKILYPDIDLTGRQLLWVPHAASRRFQLKPNENAAPSVVLTGSTVPGWYPYRHLVSSLIAKGEPNLKQIRHSGFTPKYNTYLSTRLTFVSDSAKHSASITSGVCGLRYLIAKHFEIPAMGQLLLTNEEMEPLLKQLCFVRDHHFLSYSNESMKSVIQNAVHKNNSAQNWRMRQAANDVVLNLHTTQARAQLVTQIALSLMQGQSAQGFNFSLSDVTITNTSFGFEAESIEYLNKMKTIPCKKANRCAWDVVYAKKQHSSSKPQ